MSKTRQTRKQSGAEKETAPTLKDFEKSLEELENIVERMEGDEQTLESSLTDFERGMKLVQQCRETLDQAELRVRKLVQSTEGMEESDFHDEPQDS